MFITTCALVNLSALTTHQDLCETSTSCYISTDIILQTAKIAFIFRSLSAVQIYDFHIFTVVYSSVHGFNWNQHNNQFLVGLLAQLAERCTGIAEVIFQIPCRPGFFFSGLIFTTIQVVFITAKIAFIFSGYYLTSLVPRSFTANL